MEFAALTKLMQEKEITTQYVQAFIAEDITAYKTLCSLSQTEDCKKKYKESHENIDKLTPIDLATYHYLSNRSDLKNNKIFAELENQLACCIYFEQISKECVTFIENKGQALFLCHAPKTLFAEFHHKDSMRPDTFYIYCLVDHGTPSYKVKAGPFLDKYYRCEQQQNIANTQPKISAPLMVEQFKKRITSNKIQIEGVDGKAMLSETIAFMRSLSIIRVNPFTQVAASIDFMRKHFSKLNQKDIQTYIFINLFQFDLLENQLLSAPNSMFDLLQIIQNGIDLNLQKTQMKEPSVFFLKIAFCVRKVINNIKFRSEYVQTFYARLEQNLSQIIHHFQTKPKTDYLISQLYQLHTYELLNAQFEENNLDFPQLSIPQYQKIIPAIAFRHNFEDLFFIDPFIESQARSAIGCFLRGLNTQDDLSNALYKAVKCLNIPMLTENYLKGNWQQEFPMCRLVSEKDNVEKLAVNLASGQVMIHGHSFGMLPAVVYNHPLFTRFFEGKCHPAIILQDQKCYEFSIQHKNKQTKTYRFSLEREAILQQLIELKGEKLWYQYLSVSPKEVPSLYKQYGTEIWQREKNLVVMDTLSQNVIAFYDNKTQNLYKWLIDGPKKIINHLKAEFLKPYSFITNFEDEKFLEFIESTAAEKALGLVLTIRLPRYNLEFEQRQINHKMEFVWKEDPRYKLNLEYPYQIIPGLKATLVLTSRNLKTTEKDHKEAKDTLKPLILIPKQEFMPHDQSDEEYYFYQLDINNSILRARLEIFLRYSIDELYEDKLYYYNNQEQYLKLQLIGKNQLKVLSNADEFYLAYLYLVRRQPLLSLQVLQKISMSHEGLELDQIKWLIRIITEMPIKLQLLTIQEAYITTPEFVAVRAWVGALLIQYKLSNIPVKFTLNYESTLQRNMQLKPHLRVINRDYQKFIQGGLQELFECDKYLNVKIRACYEAYLATINNIPINMRLPELLELKLLRYLSFVSTELKPKFARPVLEFLAQPHVQYRLNTLKHTRKKLQVLKLQQVRDSLNVQDTKSVDFLNQRIQKIEKSLLAPKTLMSVTTQMLNITVNLRYASPYKDLSHKDKMLLCKNTEKYEANPLKMSDWHLSIDGDDFLYSYFDLLHICITQKHPDREQLKQRIEAFINFIGMRQFEDPKLTYSTFDQLLVILNCAMKHPDKFAQFSRKIYFEQLNSLFNEIINIITKIDNNSGIAITLPVQVDDTGAFLKYVIERNKKLHKAGHSWGITVIIPKPIEAALMPYQKFESVISSKVLTVKPESVDTIESPLVEQQQQVMALFEVSKNKLIVNPVSSVFNSQVNLDVKVSHDISSSSISKQFLDQLSVDYRAGVEQNRLTATLDNTIKNYYENMDKKVLTDFITQISQFLAGEKKIIAELKLKLFSAVNSLPKDMAEAFQYKLTTMGQEFMTIKSLRIIIKLLLTKDFSLLNVHSSFNERSLQSVFELFINLMVHTTHYDLVNRLQIHLVDLNHQVIEKETVLNEICAILKSKRCFNPSEDFESLLFEFMEKKILHGLQYKYIQDLTIRQGLSFKSQSAQLIMGAGKTTVVVPEITKKKALGCNLVVIEVPESLLNLNLIDTNKTTLLVYGKPATPFVFNDGTDCTVAYLRNRLFDFNTIILNKAYLITTKGSLQSFELKFLKVLRFSDIHNPSTATKVRLFTQILKIFRNADVLIDEVDSTLDVRKQLIYSVGKGEPVPAHEISAVLALFDFAKKLDISDLLKIKQATLFDVVLEKIAIPPKLWPAILKRFAETLVYNIHSPLFSRLNAYLSKDSKVGIENNMLLVEYLMGHAKTMPAFLCQFSATDLDTIGIYKEQISQILSLTLQKLANEHFGLSKDTKKYDIEKEIAIPYRANNVPNEGSHFGHYLETMNYTIKIQLLKSLSLELTNALLRRFLHLSELALEAGADPKAYSEVEKAFEALCGRKLTSIDIESTKEVEAFHLTIRDKEQVKIYCLQNHILNHVEKNARTLRSNAQNHLSQFNSKQGITGTNWNFRCHYPHMEANQLASLGSDGQTIDHLFKSPSTPILLPELQHDAEKTIKLLFDQYLISGKKSPLHAWIDLGAYFKGITNKQIAFYLANFVSDLNKKKGLLHAFSHLQYILYFNEDNLYAMKIDGLPNNAAEVDSIILHGTKKDYIANRLNCSPDAYFTYYDQVHGTGTDIAQAKDAEALVTIGAKTLKRDKLQAVMRMRELKNLQKVIFVIPKELQDANPDFKASDWNVHTILKHCTDNEIARLADDHFRSAIMAMENILRSDLFGRILYSDRVGRQQALLIHFEDVFFTQVAKSAFEQFKHISKKETVSKVFAKVKEEITASFISLLQKSGINFVAADVKMLVENLEAIIRTAIPVCPLEVYQPNKNLTDSEIHIEKQQEVERQQELESEFDQQFRNNAVALPIKKWTYVNLLLWDLVPNTRIGGVGIYALESMRKTAEMNSPWQFSADILVTEHYLSTCEQQPNKLDTYKKEGLFILFIQDKMQKSLRSLILTPEEANYFKEKIVALRVDSHAPNRHIWIETVHQIELCGNKPSANLMDPRYMSHLEQIAFLNGDIDVLKHIFSAANTCWLKSEMMSKLQFLQKHILCVHKDKPRDLQFLYKLHSMPPQLPSLMVGHVQSIQLADMDAHVEALIQHINKAASFRKQLSALLEGPELSKPEIKSVILSYVFNDKAAASLFSWKSLTASQNATFKIKY